MEFVINEKNVEHHFPEDALNQQFILMICQNSHYELVK